LPEAPDFRHLEQQQADMPEEREAGGERCLAFALLASAEAVRDLLDVRTGGTNEDLERDLVTDGPQRDPVECAAADEQEAADRALHPPELPVEQESRAHSEGPRHEPAPRTIKTAVAPAGHVAAGDDDFGVCPGRALDERRDGLRRMLEVAIHHADVLA